jgi:transposase
VTISEERKKRVIDLYYNQGKTTREIAKIERISIRDISAIIKEEETRRQKHKHQQQEGEVSSKAYKLFSEGKRPVEVAIALNLREQEATKLYREYWKLSDCIYSIQYSRDRWQIRDILEIIPADEGKRHEY